VVERKESRGEVFLVTDGGLHHQLAASGNFGTVVRRNYPLALANRMDAPADEVASVVGCLCTPLDRLADRAALPKGAEGDVVAVFCAGAYGATASPAAFLGHGPARKLAPGGKRPAQRGLRFARAHVPNWDRGAKRLVGRAGENKTNRIFTLFVDSRW
jgi:threonine dehydrogenase-like Zn-dependent dehydrogenase